MQYKHLNIEEREKIQELFWQKKSIRHIAEKLNRSPSSISRELRRNFPKERKTYIPRLANERAFFKRTCRGRKDRLKTKEVRVYVIKHLKERWSPEQISGRIKKEGAGNISHEAIYQFIYAQIHRDGWGEIRPNHEDLRIYLRRKRKRRLRKGVRNCQRIFKLQGNSIDTRPEVVNRRERIGDWESDSVESLNHKPGINTLVERKTGVVFISKLKTRASYSTASVVRNRFDILPANLKKTITFDNGAENQKWQEIETDTGAKCFFAHPYHSWERGTNENTNGLIREYFPKKTDFTQIQDEEISKVEYDLNTRPRKRLNWSTPLEAISVALRG